MKKRLFVLFIATVLLFSALSGCGKNPPAAETEKKTYKIAVLLSGFRSDGAYNDYVYEGVKKAEEQLPVEIKFLESAEASDWENNLIAMASENYDLVIGASNQYQDIIEKQAPNFPNVKFAMIDGVVEQSNVVSVTFSFADGGFLAGAAAAIVARDMEKSDTIGFVAAMEIPIMKEFYAGFEKGVRYIQPDMNILSAYAGSFNDPMKGKELAAAQFDQGACMIVQSAASTGNGVMEAALERGKYVIGLDVMEQGRFVDTMMTSVYRHIGERVFQIIESFTKGGFAGGTTLRNEVSSKMVSLFDWTNFKRLVGDKFPQALETEIPKIEKLFVDGKLVIENETIVEK